jgi:hypothetical protein
MSLKKALQELYSAVDVDDRMPLSFTNIRRQN